MAETLVEAARVPGQVINESLVYYTVDGYARIHKATVLPIGELVRLEEEAVGLCDEAGVMRGVVPDDELDYLGTYPKEILDLVFNETEH